MPSHSQTYTPLTHTHAIIRNYTPPHTQAYIKISTQSQRFLTVIFDFRLIHFLSLSAWRLLFVKTSWNQRSLTNLNGIRYINLIYIIYIYIYICVCVCVCVCVRVCVCVCKVDWHVSRVKYKFSWESKCMKRYFLSCFLFFNILNQFMYCSAFLYIEHCKDFTT